MSATSSSLLVRCVLLGVALGGMLGGMGGCASDATVALTSISSPVGLKVRMPTRAYTTDDSFGADIYLTDLPAAALEPGADLSEVWGQIVHLHLFVIPKPGSTPIATSACSVTVRHLVLARGDIGVYGGGGFLYPETEPGEKVLEGSIRGASCRLVAATAGFADRLGASDFRADFDAPMNDASARHLAARLGEILALTRPVPDADPE